MASRKRPHYAADDDDDSGGDELHCTEYIGQDRTLVDWSGRLPLPAVPLTAERDQLARRLSNRLMLDPAPCLPDL